MIKFVRAGGILPLSYSKFVLSSLSDHFTPVQFGYSSFFLIWFYVVFFNSLGILRKETCIKKPCKSSLDGKALPVSTL